MHRYNDLLTDEEQNFINQFSALPVNSRALLARMVMRKGQYFRSRKLCYIEIGCPDIAALPLIENGYLTNDPSLKLDDLFNLLTKSELVVIFGLSGKIKALAKPEMLDVLRKEFIHPKAFSEWQTGAHERVYKIQVADLYERLRLMFFGNLYQSWSAFVLSDLGVYRYEQVEFSSSSRGFNSRNDIERYLHLHRCRERLNNGEPLDDIVLAIPVVPFQNTWLEGRRNKLLFRLAQQYERCSDFSNAFNIYKDCRHPGARLRSIRVKERSDQMECAFQLAVSALQMPESEAEQQALLRMMPRLHKKNGHLKPTSIKRFIIERIELVLPYPDPYISVEKLVCNHFCAEDAPVLYVENTLINSLFGLLCWRAIFTPLPGAFFHPFHHGPADLHSADFYQRRAAIFSLCLLELDSEQYKKTILETYTSKQGIQSPFVFWSHLTEDLLNMALDCLPALHLRKWFERILLDIASNRCGLPDLIQFWPKEHRYRLLEVKGPGDRLQDNQARWLHYCQQHDMPVAVCYVQWEESAAI